MVEIIAAVVLVASTAGTLMFIVKKMPAAGQVPVTAGDARAAGFLGSAGGWIAAKLKKNPYLKDFSWIDFAQKQLLKTRVVVMKAENKINDYMIKLRQRAEEKRSKEEASLDNYWHDLKTIVKTKKPLIVVKNSRSSEPEDSLLGIEETVIESAPQTYLAEHKLSDPAIKVVMPDDVAQKPVHHHKKKRGGSGKKNRFRDPFRW